MTREEAIKSALEYKEYSYGVIDTTPLINRIYDDFKSRTCESCNKSSYIEYKNTMILRCSYITGYHPDKDFGCNKFERNK